MSLSHNKPDLDKLNQAAESIFNKYDKHKKGFLDK